MTFRPPIRSSTVACPSHQTTGRDAALMPDAVFAPVAGVNPYSKSGVTRQRRAKAS